MTSLTRTDPSKIRFRCGFSLVELMLVLALLGILVALATPSYRGFVLRAHRVDALGQLMQVAACQERLHAVSGAYDTGRCLPAADRYYRLQYDTPGIAATQSYRVTAHPLGTQRLDRCGSLSLDQSGFRSAGADAALCWAAR